MKKFKWIIAGLISISFLWACQTEKEVDKNRTLDRPVQISGEGMDASCVYLTTDEKGHPLISWTEIDPEGGKYFYVSFWDDAEGRFSRVESIPIPENTSIHEEGMPKVEVKGDGSLLALYEISAGVPGSKWGISDIQYVQSFDKGRSWTSPETVVTGRNPETSSSFSGITRLPDGEIAVGWLGTSANSTVPGRPVYFAKTLEGGGFGMPVLVDPHACECCRVAVAADESGVIRVAYRDLSLESVRDISLATSVDGGKNFLTYADISADQWEVDGCPHNGPSIISRGSHTYMTWFTNGKDEGIHYMELDSDHEVLDRRWISSSGRFAQIDLLENWGPILVCNESYNENEKYLNRIMINRIDREGIYKMEISDPGVHAEYPVVVPLDESSVLVAWRQENDVFYKAVDLKEVNTPDLFSGINTDLLISNF